MDRLEKLDQLLPRILVAGGWRQTSQRSFPPSLPLQEATQLVSGQEDGCVLLHFIPTFAPRSLPQTMVVELLLQRGVKFEF